MKWFVIYTKPNCEIKVANSLIELGLNAYCPVYSIIRQYSDRKKRVDKPLLPSYVLVKLNEKDRPKVFSIPGVIRYLFWLGKPAEVKDNEVLLLKSSLKGVHDDVVISKLVKGEEYKIISGPFNGYKGNVLEVLKNKLRLELPVLGMSISLNRVTNA